MTTLDINKALEIFLSPNDMIITVGTDLETLKFGFSISNGPRRHFNLIIMSDCIIETLDDAVEAVKELLKACCESAKKVYEDALDFLDHIVNPNHLPVDESCALNLERIDKIIEELKKTHFVKTYLMFARE